MPKAKFWLFSLLIFTLLFYPLLTTYFSMDDFFHFTVFPISGSWGEFFNIFKVYKFEDRGIAFYRPVSRELPFFIFYHIFGLQSLPLRLLQIIIHIINAILVYKLIFNLTKEKVVAQLTSFFVFISVINTAVLYYLAGGIQSSLVTTFLLLTCLAYKKYLTKPTRSNLFKTYTFNLLALMSFETAVALPFLLFGVAAIKNKLHSHKQNIFKVLIPSLVLSILFFLINYFYIGFSSLETQYTLNLSPIKAVNTLAWYTLWSLGLPEMLIDFVGPGLHLNPNLMAFWGRYFVIIFPTFFALLALVISSAYVSFRAQSRNLFSVIPTKIRLSVIPTKRSARRNLSYDLKLIFFFIFSFVALLGPFLLLPNHKSTHYIAPALPFFWAAVIYVIYKSQIKLIFPVFVVLIILLNSVSVKLGEKTYWAVQRGNLAKKVLTQLKSEHPTLPTGTTLYIKNDPNYPKLKGDWGASSTQVSHVLSGEDAIRLLYNDPSIKVLYEDLSSSHLRNNTVIEFVAKIN